MSGQFLGVLKGEENKKCNFFSFKVYVNPVCFFSLKFISLHSESNYELLIIILIDSKLVVELLTGHTFDVMHVQFRNLYPYSINCIDDQA